MKNCTTASCCIVCGISRTADEDLRGAGRRGRGAPAASRSNAAMSSGGYSRRGHGPEHGEQERRPRRPGTSTSPSAGCRWRCVPSDAERAEHAAAAASASVAPSPMKKLCITKPAVRCSSDSLSATNARNGSIVMLIDASRIQSRPAAIQSVEDVGMKNSARLDRIAPDEEVRAPAPQPAPGAVAQRPTIGCTSSPVSGAASQSSGI